MSHHHHHPHHSQVEQDKQGEEEDIIYRGVLVSEKKGEISSHHVPTEVPDTGASLFVGLTRQKLPVHSHTPADKRPIPPIMFVPGLSGSAFLSGDTDPPRRVWMAPKGHELDTLYILAKWEDGVTKDTKPITVVPGLAGMDLNGDETEPVNFDSLIAYLNERFHMTVGDKLNIDAAPYDWRKVPGKVYTDEWCKHLEHKIEDLYKWNETHHQPIKKVKLIAISMGNNMVMYFLNNFATKEWKDKYISGFIAVAPPFGGAPMAVQGDISGMKYAGLYLPPFVLKPFSSIPWLFPDPRVSLGTIVTVGNTEYSASKEDIVKLFSDVPLALGKVPKEIFESVIQELVDKNIMSTHPEVPVDIVAPRVVFEDEEDGPSLGPAPTPNPTPRTPVRFSYAFWGATVQIDYEESPPFGDGVVPYASLHANDESWCKTHPHQTLVHVINYATHAGVLSNTDFHKLVASKL